MASKISPRLIINQKPVRLEDDRNFMKICSQVFKDNQMTPNDDALVIMARLNITTAEIQNKSFEKFSQQNKSSSQERQKSPRGSPRQTEPLKEIIQVRYNNFQNKRKFLIGKIADELNLQKKLFKQQQNYSMMNTTHQSTGTNGSPTIRGFGAVGGRLDMSKVRASNDYAAYPPDVQSKTFNLTQLMYPSGSASGKSINKPNQKHLDVLKAKFQPNKRLSPHEIKKLFSPRLSTANPTSYGSGKVTFFNSNRGQNRTTTYRGSETVYNGRFTHNNSLENKPQTAGVMSTQSVNQINQQQLLQKMQEMEKKLLKQEKRWKKKTEDRWHELNLKAEKLDAKRQKAKENFTNRMKDKDHEGNVAYSKCLREIEQRIKNNQDEEQQAEIQKYKNFKVYMTQQQQRQEQMKSLDDLEAIKAREHLIQLESKIKHRNEIYHSKILETSQKAQQVIEQSKSGYDKHSQLYDYKIENHCSKVLKKNDIVEKKRKKVQQLNKDQVQTLQEKMQKKIDGVDAKKILVRHEKDDRIREVHERSRKKEELKNEVLHQKQIGHQMLKEVHELRKTNVQNNLIKEQNRRKQYQEELALKLEMQKHRIQLYTSEKQRNHSSRFANSLSQPSQQ